MKTVFAVLILIVPTLVLSACGLLPSSKWDPAVNIVITAENPADATPENLASAQKVINNRLGGMLNGNAYAEVNGQEIYVRLKDKNDIEVAQKLSTGPGRLVFWEAKEPIAEGSTVPEGFQPVLTEADIADVLIERDELGGAVVVLNFTAAATKKLADFTQAHIGMFIPISLDGVVIVCPRIDTEVTEGQASVSGNFSLSSANQLAVMLRYHPLPVKVAVKEIQEMSAQK